MAADGITLPASSFDEVFPFHFAFGPDLTILRRGHSLARVCPQVAPGAQLARLFEPIRPEAPFVFAEILQAGRTLYLIKEVATGVVLRGQMLSLMPAQNAIVFLGSPWLPEPAAITQLGLSFEDFAVHDPALDLLQVLQSQKIAVADLKRLAEKLHAQRAALREANEKLRQQEAESRKLALIAARTDNAVVLTDAQGYTEWINEGFTRLTGYTFQDLKGKKPGAVLQGPGTDTETVRRIGERLRKGEGFSEEILNYGKDGRCYWLAIEVQPIRDANGRITNFMAIETDITERRAAQQRLAVQFEVSKVLAESESLADVVPRLLQAIGENLGWQTGQFWHILADHLRCLDIWHEPSAPVETFIAASRAIEFDCGQGLPGRVWATRQPAWIADVTQDSNFPRRLAAASDGLHGAFAFPVIARGELWGVAEFFSRNIEEPDESLLQAFAAVGSQIGQFIIRREVEEQLQRTSTLQRAILESASYSIISTTPGGTILTFNSAAERLLGYTPPEMVGKRDLAAIHDPAEIQSRAAELSRELGRKVDAGFEALAALAALGKPDEREWTYLRKDGGRLPVLLSMTALFGEHGQVAGYLGVASDITERKRVAEELLKAKEAAEDASRAKSDFLAMMSHEIRTPMNAVIGMTRLLLDTPLAPDQAEFARTAAHSGEALVKIIDDILDFSKIEAGEHFHFETEAFSLRDLLDGVTQMLRPRAEAQRVALSSQVDSGLPDIFRSDAGRLRQVLVNLVGNALKFTEKGGVQARATGKVELAGQAHVRFEVEDTGIGIGQRDVERLFQPFTQVDGSASRRRGGTGLGLAISRRIVELMGGRIGVSSTPDQGSLFWFELDLPLAEAEALGSVKAAITQPPTPRSALTSCRILVAEDHEINRRLMVLLLEKMGYRADFALNGLEALEAWERLNPDVILMDCQMPEMDGYEATREIRAREAARGRTGSQRVHIIALTANALAGSRERCLAAGMDEYLRKPFTERQLSAAIECRPGAHPPSDNQANTPSFDSGQLAELFTELGNEGVVAIIQDFLEELPSRAQEIATLAMAGDLPELARHAHKLRGISRTVGMVGFADALFELENRALAGDREAAVTSLQSLSAICEKNTAALRSWLDAHEA